ncbi:MAG: mobile mystery protein A [Thermodesulfobacteriales bacterium]|nr:MAG: mobile mystery protein A [Thermodesulfobacteriales bacterium]
MNIVKKIAREQYKDLVDSVAKKLRTIQIPKEGWLSTTRNALGLSVAQLAGRMSVTRQDISKIERNELTGSVTLKTMQNIAEAMGCRFVYAIVPRNRVEDLLVERAKIIATRIVETTNKHMALEDQALSDKQISNEINRMQKEILQDIPSDFWNDEV